MYTDFRQKHVTVPSLRPGETLEFSTVTTIHTPLAAGHFWLEYDFQDRGINLDEQLEVNVPLARTITLKTSDKRQPATSDADGRRVYTWKGSHTETPKKDDKDANAGTGNADEAEPVSDVRLTTFQSASRSARSKVKRGRRQPRFGGKSSRAAPAASGPDPVFRSPPALCLRGRRASPLRGS